MKIAALAGLALVAACGDPLVGPEFAGTPQLSLGGVVQQGQSRIPSMHGPLELSVFWIGTATVGGARVEQEARLDSGLAEYTMRLFDAPPVAASGFSDLLPGGSLAIGVIALYADKNASGALELGSDLLLGASAGHVVVFAGADVPQGAPAAQTLGPIGAGYHVFALETPGLCRFVMATSCAPAGGLTRVEAPTAVALTLWSTAEEVVVPAPTLMRNGVAASIWAPAP